ncbi:hypothetical protein J7T55_002517 [Diaporthe amygdali]|uniref:uncharacterized protein n=1 Tax=Phomopsis amygdali TaxID=1214568 RepID=UPI0022FF07AA|nr:uncharacterized protein J7T55_002517 [Diaporthe amygdali]KAJ0122006.1 hypothetical protein J7T55_002517 [Diaporthe amygdali]
MEDQDIVLYERWGFAHIAPEETRQDSPVISLPRQVKCGWQPPPSWAFDGCSAKLNEALWRKCLEQIEADISREKKSQSRDNMKACLGWIKLYGYPSSHCFMVWAACGIATCTTRREFSRFWVAHGQCSERTSVYALEIHDDGTIVNWRLIVLPRLLAYRDIEIPSRVFTADVKAYGGQVC